MVLDDLKIYELYNKIKWVIKYELITFLKEKFYIYLFKGSNFLN